MMDVLRKLRYLVLFTASLPFCDVAKADHWSMKASVADDSEILYEYDPSSDGFMLGTVTASSSTSAGSSQFEVPQPRIYNHRQDFIPTGYSGFSHGNEGGDWIVDSQEGGDP